MVNGWALQAHNSQEREVVSVTEAKLHQTRLGNQGVKWLKERIRHEASHW
jgi:hypothetical protein